MGKLVLQQEKYDIEDIKEKIDQYPIVSFDIFDTLLKRNVQKPEDVFYIMEGKIKVDGFAQKRIRAEKMARKYSGLGEVTLKDIYSFIDVEENIEKLMEIEQKIEQLVLNTNIEIMEVYQYCLEQKKHIYLISDMYLPPECIKRVLKKSGYSGYERLYLSCVIGKTKRSGELFAEFLKLEKVRAMDVIHIGDSYCSDYKNAIKYGIAAIHIPGYIHRAVRCSKDKVTSLKMNCLYSSINNWLPSDKSQYYNFGFSSFGPFLWGYVKWLHKNFIEHQFERVYFFSRDGLIIKKAYEACFGEACIKNYYLEVSRRSLRVPILWMDYSFKTLLGMLSPSGLISLKSVFDGVGLDINQYRVLIEKYGFNIDSVFDQNRMLGNEALMKMYEELTDDIIQNSKAEYQMLVDYLAQNNVKGKFAIVDIGWSGGMQRFLGQILSKLDIEHEIHGYYVGVAAYFSRNKEVLQNLDLSGYLFDFSHNLNAVDLRSPFVGLFETMFLEQGGSVRSYYRENDRVRAERYPYEYIVDGRRTKELISVSDLQEGALDFIKHASRDKILSYFIYKPEELFGNLYECGIKPTERELRLFADFRFYDEGVVNKLAAPNSILYYLKNFRELKKDFMLSRWKIGFMKRLLKVNLSYLAIYNALLKLK